jgi:hypothetical protein
MIPLCCVAMLSVVMLNVPSENIVPSVVILDGAMLVQP